MAFTLLFEQIGTLPEPTSVWRFMSLEKLLFMLEKRKLHFSQLTTMQDKHEAAWPRSQFEWEKTLGEKFYAEIGFDAVDWANEHQEIMQRTNYVVCWYLSEIESSSMWAHYGHNGVAIRTSFGRLMSALEESGETGIVGRVQYVDFRTYKMPNKPAPLVLPFLKRQSYQHENELRLVINHHPEIEDDPDPEKFRLRRLDILRALPSGLDIDINTNLLIERIYVSPKCPIWLRETISSLVNERYELGAEIVTSEVDARPEYR